MALAVKPKTLPLMTRITLIYTDQKKFNQDHFEFGKSISSAMRFAFYFSGTEAGLLVVFRVQCTSAAKSRTAYQLYR